MSNPASLSICGVPTTIDQYELVHFILQKTLQGQELYAKGVLTSSGRLLPHSLSLDLEKQELASSLLVRISTDDGIYIVDCGALTHIDTKPIPDNPTE